MLSADSIQSDDSMTCLRRACTRDFGPAVGRFPLLGQNPPSNAFGAPQGIYQALFEGLFFIFSTFAFSFSWARISRTRFHTVSGIGR